MNEAVLNLLDDFARGAVSWQEAMGKATAMIGVAGDDSSELVLAALLNGFCVRAYEQSYRGGTGTTAKTLYVDVVATVTP